MNRLFFHLIIHLLLLAQVPLNAQSNSNSLEIHIKQLLALADSISSNDIHQAIEKTEEALQLAQENQLPQFKIKAYTELGVHQSALQKYTQAQEYYEKALEESQQQQDIEGEIIALIGIAGILERKGEYQASLKELLKANALVHSLQNPSQSAKIYASIAHIYFNYGEFDEAIKLLNKAKQIHQETNNLQALAAIHNNIALVHKMNQQIDSAKWHFLASVELGTTLQDELGNLQTYNNISMMYLTDNKLDTAEHYQLKALELAQKLEIENLFVYYNLARLYLAKQHLLEAEKNALISLSICEQENVKSETMKNKMLLAQIYAAQGNYKLAYQHQKEVEPIKDEIFESDISSEVELMENKYQLQQKELKLMALDRSHQERQYQLLGLLGLFLFSIILGILLFRQRHLKNKEERLLLEQRLLRSQMNPHFVFNALSVIQGFIFKNKAKDAGRYLAKFSMLIRMILEHSRQAYIPLEQELTALEYYLELQQLRFRDKFDYHIVLDEALFPEQIAIAPMLIQPFIENAIEHGIQHKDGKGMLQLHFSMYQNSLSFTLEDDGVGRARAAILKNNQRKHASLSTQITEERLLLYQQKSKLPFRLSISDRLNPTQTVIGTKVAIQIPYKYL